MTTSQSDQNVLPFRIEIPASELDNLQGRLRSTRFPDPLPDDDWEYGIPVATLRDLVDQWAAHDWRATEQRLNGLPQIMTTIDGQPIHAVHVHSAEPDTVPILLLHGWPGSFLEFEGLIDPLTDPVAHGGDARDAFDVVIPSHPGFGFSTPLVESAWGEKRHASTYLELMTRLGYDRFVVQGGDHGAGIAPEIGRLAPERVIGVHVNGGTSYFNGELDEASAAALTPLERSRIARVAEFMRKEFGYIAIQGTRPGLIGVMTADSPVAQFAWIYDKLQAWTTPKDAPAVDLLGDFVFENASLYWLTATAGSAAMVVYAQTARWGVEKANSGVQTAVIAFAHDVGLRFVEERENTIVRWTDVEDRGGHFAALEEPGLLVSDIREFVRNLSE